VTKIVEIKQKPATQYHIMLLPYHGYGHCTLPHVGLAGGTAFCLN